MIRLICLVCSAVLLLAYPRGGWSGDYSAPLSYAAMYDRLTIGMSWREVYELTRAGELQQAPTDLDTTDLLRMEVVNRRCQAQLLRLHWYRKTLYQIEYFQLDSAGVTYRERGDPDPIGAGFVRRLTDMAQVYASHWDQLTALVAEEGSPTLLDKAKQAETSLKRRLEELRHEGHE